MSYDRPRRPIANGRNYHNTLTSSIDRLFHMGVAPDGLGWRWKLDLTILMLGRPPAARCCPVDLNVKRSAGGFASHVASTFAFGAFAHHTPRTFIFSRTSPNKPSIRIWKGNYAPKSCNRNPPTLSAALSLSSSALLTVFNPSQGSFVLPLRLRGFEARQCCRSREGSSRARCRYGTVRYGALPRCQLTSPAVIRRDF